MSNENDEPKKPIRFEKSKSIIKKSMQTEMDRRLECVREYLIMQEQLTPLATFEFNCLMNRLSKDKEDKDV